MRFILTAVFLFLSAKVMACECGPNTQDPHGEDLFQSSAKNINVYRVSLTTAAGRDCTADLRVESSFEQVKVRLLARRCR